MKMFLVWLLILITDPVESKSEVNARPAVWVDDAYEASLTHRVYGVARLARYRARHAAREWVAPPVGMVWRHVRAGGWWNIEIDRPDGWLTA